MEVVCIKKILSRNLLIYIGFHCVRRSWWTVTTLATLTINIYGKCVQVKTITHLSCTLYNSLYFTNSNIKPGNALDNSFRTQTVEAARADAERVRLIGASEARAIEAVGRAEAEKMRMKASAYKQYGDAAIMALVLEALPQIAAEVAAPLAKTDEIVLLGGADKTTTEVNKLLGQLPPAISALTGVDVTGALGKIPGATMKVA